MKHCPRKNTPTAIGVSTDGLVTAHKLGCKSWNCPYCSRLRAKYLAHKCYTGIEAYKAQGIDGWYFGTVTMHKNWRGWASLQNWYANWNKFYQRMKRGTEGQLFYVLLPEQHKKDGSLHVHLISTCQASTNDFHDWGARSGLGFKNENTPLDSSQAGAWYVTKYVGKSLGVLDWPPRFRRVRFSIRWPEPEHDSEWSWIIPPKDTAHYWMHKRIEQGYVPVALRTGEIKHASH